jgi:hypothetical protein
LIEGLSSETVVRDSAALNEFTFTPAGVSEAISRELAKEDRFFEGTSWNDYFRWRDTPVPIAGVLHGTRYVDTHTIDVECPAEYTFKPIQCIGGDNGWYYANYLWAIRGWIDRLLGGPGLGRMCPNPDAIQPGDHLDWWCVESYEKNCRLRLFAEMKVPGRAWLDFEVTDDGEKSTIRQTAVFDAKGLMGLLYWWSLVPFHSLIFRGMLRNIATIALREYKNSLK